MLMLPLRWLLLVRFLWPVPKFFHSPLPFSPVPGNIYDMDHFFYDPATCVSQGDFEVVLAFPSIYGHPVVVHKCPDVYDF